MAPAGVRPPGIGCDTSSRQVAQSNSTLNTWLTGRRQPSWLNNAKSVAPTPRNPQAGQSPRTHSVQLPAAVLPITASHPAPATASVAVAADDEAECPELASPAQPQSSSATTLPCPQSPDKSDEISSEATGTHPSAQVANMPTTTNHAVARPQRAADSASFTRLDHSLPPASRDHETAPSDLPTPIMTPVLPVPVTSNLPEIHATEQASHITPLSNLSPSTADPTQRSRQRSETEAESGVPAKRRRTLPSNLNALKAWRTLENLAELKRQWNSIQPLDPALEQPRFHLLEDACQTGDLFYVVLHQVFCLWTINPFEIWQLFQQDTNLCSMAESGLHAVSNLLRSNTSMRQSLLNCFANFPASFASMQHETAYFTMLRAVVKFLFSMANRWSGLLHQHAVDGVPLLMDELLGQLHMHSHVLQIIVFRASRRTAGVADGPVAMQMELLFKEDQRFHTAQDGNFMLKTHDAAYTRYLETINTRYKQMVQLSRGQQNIAVRAHSQQEHQPLPQYTHPPANAVPGHGPPRVDHVSPLLAQNQQWSVLPSQASPKMVGASHFQTTQVHHDHGSATARQMQAPPGYPGVNSPSTMSPQVQSPTSLAPLQYSVQPWANSAQERQQFVEANRHQSRAMTSFGESPIQLHPTLRNAQYPLVGSPVLNQSPVFPSAVMNARSSSGSPIVWPHAFPSPTTTNAFNVQGRRPSQPQAQQPVPAKQIANGLLFPTPEYRLPINEYPSDPQDNTCVLHSLHQAHVRSPRRFPVHSETAHERHYQSVRKLALGPVPVPPAKMIHKFSFSLSAKDQDRLSRTEILPGLDVSVHRYASGSLRLRIRCCYLAGSQPQITDSEWVTKDMVWPEHLFIEVNRFSLSLRRKAHHSKDLPVDIPANILLEENSVHVWVPETHLRPRDVPKDSQPYIAIELVETLSHSAILSLVRTHGVQSLSSTLEVIKRRLAGSSACKNDDDLAMISHELAIDLADPFTSTIFKIPVRGSNCTHLECFDLETWLNTRLGKKKICTCGKDSGSCKTCPSEPSFVDKWKCPLCSADARPYSLRIDQWLQGVRDKLEARGQLRAKSIFVTADGTWKIKDLPDEDDDDDDSGNDNGDVLKTANVNTANVKRAGNISRAGTVAAAGPGTASSAPIVIEIDDD